MATSPETLAQVRDLLRKMDRSIDDARDKRLSHDSSDAPATPAPPTNASVPSDPAEDPQAKPGRARPMAPRPDWQNTKSDRWARPS